MPHIPPAVAETDLSREIQKYLPLKHRGKVRDTYELPGHPDKLLVVATDRISIFDFVLNAEVPDKGAVLTAMTVFWLLGPLSKFSHHLEAFGRDTDVYLPSALRGNIELQKRALVVEKLEMLPIEFIARGYLTGSGLKAYQKDGAVCAIPLPPGLQDGSRLPQAIFTPTTKAEEGHDEHVDAAWVDQQYGSKLGRLTLEIYDFGRAYAENRGVIIADTKFELGRGSDRKIVLGDEVLTPDSSRFWDIGEYEAAQIRLKSPSGYDKEPVRQEGKRAVIDSNEVDISKLDPSSEPHVLLVGRWHVPEDVISETTARYRAIFHRLAGASLGQFQAQIMGIPTHPTGLR